jgi:hypothetical protein
MIDTRFNLLPTMIGSLPHQDPKRACEVVAHYLKDLPAWPQLPSRSALESMVPQFSEGFPGLITKDRRLMVDSREAQGAGMETLYSAYLENKVDAFPISPARAAGLYDFLKLNKLNPLAVKGQITGPISFGLGVMDESGKPIIYDETSSDAAAKLLRLKASWEEKQLHKLSPRTIIFVDEPGMASYGSAFFSLPRDRVLSLLTETLGGIQGLSGIHCCGNTDWPLVIATGVNILSFDAYNFAGSLSLYPEDVVKLISDGGAVAWGIVPSTAEGLAGETVASLKDRLEEAMAPFTRCGVRFSQLKEQALLTPSCGLAGLTENGAEKALELLVRLSNKIRGKAE